MLIIRNAQVEALKSYMLGRFVDRVVYHLSSRFPDELQGFETIEIKEMIHEGIQRCQSYNLESEAHIVRFIELMFQISPDFDIGSDYPWVMETFKNNDYPPRKKIDIVRTKFNEYAQDQKLFENQELTNG